MSSGRSVASFLQPAISGSQNVPPSARPGAAEPSCAAKAVGMGGKRETRGGVTPSAGEGADARICETSFREILAPITAPS